DVVLQWRATGLTITARYSNHPVCRVPRTGATLMSEPDRFLMAGVMGYPVMHSRSPRMHNFWLEKHGIAGRYMPLAIKPDAIEKALRALPALGFSGCNLTMPHKETAVPLMDRVSPLVKKIGAMNCVVVASDGTLEGHNFEAGGYAASLAQEIPGW